MMHATLSRICAGDYDSFFLIAGPCVVESYEVCAEVADQLKSLCVSLDLPLVFKASLKKANRTSLHSFYSIGEEDALEILGRIKQDFDLAITTDVHETTDMSLIEDIVDLIQIPAFLCRQTDLLVSAGSTDLPVNIKKGQFATASTMIHAVEKVRSGRSDLHPKTDDVFLTERGFSHGYHDLVVDPKSLAAMSASTPTIIDITHANQKPNQAGGVTTGSSDSAELLARVGLVSGVTGLFLETHPDPSVALSDGATMIALDQVGDMLKRLKALSIALRSI